MSPVPISTSQEASERLIRLAQAGNRDAMAILVSQYREYMVWCLKRALPHCRRPPVSQYLGAMVISFMRCVELWDGSGKLATYCYKALIQTIFHQRHRERLVVPPRGNPARAFEGLKLNRIRVAMLVGAKRAVGSWQWQRPPDAVSDKHWNNRVYCQPLRESVCLDSDHIDPADIAAALRKLPARHRRCILRMCQGYTSTETAAVMGCSPGVVRNLIMRGIATIRERLYLTTAQRRQRKLIVDVAKIERILLWEDVQ